MSSYATPNPPTPVTPWPPLNLKGPSDLCPGPKKPYKAPLGYFSYNLLLCPGTSLSKLLWRKASVANRFFTDTCIILSFAAVKLLVEGVLFDLKYIITISIKLMRTIQLNKAGFRSCKALVYCSGS